MRTHFIKATPGWGTGNIDSVFNEWLDNNNVKILDVKYETHTQMFLDYTGLEKEGVVYTALVMYEI